MQSQSVDEELPALVRNQGDKYVCNPQLGSSQRPLFFYNRHTQAFSLALPLVRSRHLEAKKLMKKSLSPSLFSHLPLGRELLDFVLSPWENLTHNWWQWMLGGFEVLMESTGLGLKLEDIPSKKWSQARRCRISAEKAHPGHGFCSL